MPTTSRSSTRVLSTTGVVFLPNLSASDRSLAARHWNAVRRYLETGDDTALRTLEQRAVVGRNGGAEGVGGVELEFRLNRIEYHAFRGDVRFEAIYDEVV